MSRLPLSGVRVVDVTTNVAGPFCTHVLGGLGAEVVKVERPGSGDDTRAWGPPFWGGVGLTFLDLNRGKRSIALDLKEPADREVLLELVAGADVFVQNLRPTALASLGLGPEDLTAQFPRLVYADISGFGAVGPMRDAPAFDPLMQAFTGLMGITGHDGADPARIPVSMLDKGAGMWAVIGILAALRDVSATGTGAVVRTSLLETAFGFQSVQASGRLATGVEPRRLGSGTVGIAPYEAFPTADHHVVVAAGNDRLFARLCRALGSEELSREPRYSTNPDRVRHRESLSAELAALTRRRTTRELVAALLDHGVPHSPVHTMGQALDSEQVKAMRVFQPVDGMPDDVQALRLPLSFDGDLDSTLTAPPPVLPTRSPTHHRSESA